MVTHDLSPYVYIFARNGEESASAFLKLEFLRSQSPKFKIILDQQPDPVGSEIISPTSLPSDLPMKTLVLEGVSSEKLQSLITFSQSRKIDQSLITNYKLINLTQLYFFCEEFQIFGLQDVVVDGIYNLVTDIARFNEEEFGGMCAVVRQFGGVAQFYNQIWLLAIECVALLFPSAMIRQVPVEIKEHAFLLIRHHHDTKEEEKNPRKIRPIESFRHKNKKTIRN